MSKKAYVIYRPVISRRVVRLRKFSWVLSTILIIFFILIGIVIYNIFHLKNQPVKKSIGKSFTQVIAGPTLYKSTYFQFYDTNKWVFVPANSTSNSFNYFTYQGGVPVDSMTVYVNNTPLQDTLATSYVLPVSIVNGNAFTVEHLSDNCKTLYKPTDLMRIKTVSLSGTSMLCVPDSPQFTVVVGKVGGNYNLNLHRSNGQLTQYIILYHNLSVSPSEANFVRIMKSFQAI
jgi:hypothetical protein